MDDNVCFLLNETLGKDIEKKCLITLDGGKTDSKNICHAIIQFVDLYNQGYHKFYCPISTPSELKFVEYLLAICHKQEFENAILHPIVLDNTIDSLLYEKLAADNIELVFLDSARLFERNSSTMMDIPIQAIISFPGDEKSFSRKIITWALHANWKETKISLNTPELHHNP